MPLRLRPPGPACLNLPAGFAALPSAPRRSSLQILDKRCPSAKWCSSELELTSRKSCGPSDVVGLASAAALLALPPSSDPSLFCLFLFFLCVSGSIFAYAFPQPVGGPASPRIRGPLHEAAYTCLRDPRVAEARYAKINPPPLVLVLTTSRGTRPSGA
jgi:hypothetical protein